LANVQVIELVGVDYGPLVVMAVDRGAGLIARCPACREELPLDDDSLGREIVCAQPGCGAVLRVGPSIVESGARP
jgi:hypothetical protein